MLEENSFLEENITDKNLFFWSRILSVFIYSLSLLFTVAWALSFSNEWTIVSNSNFYSRILFFLNPRLFTSLLSSGSALDLISGASNLKSFVFITCYYVTVVAFVFIYCASGILFVISYLTKVRYFQYIACFGVFPILGVIFNTYYLTALYLYTKSSNEGKNIKFKRAFTSEDSWEEDDDLVIEEDNPYFQYTYRHYKKMYLPKEEEPDTLTLLHDAVVKDLNVRMSNLQIKNWLL